MVKVITLQLKQILSSFVAQIDDNYREFKEFFSNRFVRFI